MKFARGLIVKKETEKAFEIAVGKNKYKWVPKSICEYEDVEIGKLKFKMITEIADWWSCRNLYMVRWGEPILR